MKDQITKIRKEGILLSILQKIKRILKKYYEQLYVNKLDSFSKMDLFLEIQKLPKQTQEERKNPNSPVIPITSKQIEFVI